MSTHDPAATVPLLLEIGTEEIPSRFLPPAIADLKNISAAVLDEFRIDYREIRTFATPRRIVLMIHDVSTLQRDVSKEVFGPSKKVAFDEQGNPTRAAAGFAASFGINVSDLVIRTKGKGDYVAAVIEEKGTESKAVMPEIMKKIVLSLRFPKSMRWGDGNLLFVRPIHWLVTLFGADTITIEIDGIKSGNITRGHRFLSPAGFQIRDISSYLSLLENNFVVLDQQKRAGMIRKGIAALAADAKGQPLMDEELIETVAFLVEYPVPVLCGFDAEYLDLPKELLITVMKDHQKYFALQDGNDKLLNSFVVISNTRADNAETVRIGAERVIRARFDDAKFYFHEDRKKRLADRVSDLRLVTFHDELGSLLEKTERVSLTASFLAERLSLSHREKAVRAATISKTDLLSGVVREFPELQGVMGKYYALYDGEEKDVAVALEEQYLPKSFGGRLPSSDTGALLSLADKIDNVASFFAIGLIPTGSEDPFALRRQAMGIASIIVDRGYAITIEEIFAQALRNLSNITIREKTLENIMGFMEQRVEFILSSSGYEQDLIKSVLSLSLRRPLRTIIGRLDALRAFRKEEGFAGFLLAIKRVNNIVPKKELHPVKEALLSQDEEKNLHGVFMAVRDNMQRLLQEENFPRALTTLAEITTAVNNFFDRVLVMDKQEEVKLNRLSLLREIWETAFSVADFSKLS
jgi:glycyl-tRNA synthetase beta chain